MQPPPQWLEAPFNTQLRRPRIKPLLHHGQLDIERREWPKVIDLEIPSDINESRDSVAAFVDLVYDPLAVGQLGLRP